LFIFFTWTNQYFHLLWKNITLSNGPGLAHLVIERAIGFYVHTGCNYLVMLLAVVLFLRLLLRGSTLSGLQVTVCILALLSPMLVNIFYLFGLGALFPLDLTPFALVTAGMAIGWFTFRFQFWEILPVARNAIVESMNDGVIVLNKRNIVIDVNPSARRLLALEQERTLGRPIAELMPNWSDLQPVQQLLNGAEVTQSRVVELALFDNEMQVRYIDLLISNIYDRNNRVTGHLLTLHDITRRKLVEQVLANERNTLTRRVEERTADLSEANAQLARAARLKDEFLASMSHELRTPLNTILGMSEALQEYVYGPLTRKQEKALRSIEESGRHLLALINDILDVSKLEAGQLALELQPVSVETVCQASLGLIKHISLKKQITVTSHIDPMIKVIDADERRLKQMIVNLLSNAVKFTPENGNVSLEVSGDEQEEVVHFTVSDNGIGIRPEDIKRLFQPFVQLDSSIARHHEGTGLGLALVYRMTEMHGGSITVESEMGVGSRFTISLPWITSAESTLIKQKGSVQGTLANLHRALIISNSTIEAERTAQYLRELAIEAIIYTQSHDIVRYTQAAQPDVILLDMFMSERSGWDILSELRAKPQTRLIPVILISLMDATPPNPILADPSVGRLEMLLRHFSREQLNRALFALFSPRPLAIHNGTMTLPPPYSLRPSGHYPTTLLPHILLVEDNEANIDTFSDYLQARGYHVQIARTGDEAIARLSESQPALILLDIQMPGMDGLEVMHRVRTNRQWCDLPIIALTALAMAGDRERCLAAGATEYLSKPISLKTLIGTIEKNLQRK
ncbi:MAG: response regulator, partial [Chloroflexi bacterium]|nr:response regulator [Chloroflexota bacterium]